MSEGAWILGGQIATVLGTVVGVRLLTEFVPPNAYGEVGLFLGVVTFGETLLCQPLLQAVLRFYPDLAKEQQVELLRRTIGRSLVWTTGTMAGLVLLVGGYFSTYHAISYPAVIAAALLLVVETARSFETNLLTAARRQRAYSSWLAVEALARLGCALLFVIVIGPTAEAVLWGYGFGTLTVYAGFVFGISREGVVRTATTSDQKAILGRAVRKYFVPLVPLALFFWISTVNDRYVIGGFLGLDKVGVYVAAYGLTSRPFLIMGAIVLTTLRPLYFNAVSSGDRELEKKTMRVWLGLIATLCVLGVAGVAVMRTEIAGLFLGARYRESADLMPWIAGGYALLAISTVFETVCYAHKRTSLIWRIQGAGAFATLAVGIAFVYWFGILGAAMTLPISFGLQCVVAWRIAKRIDREVDTRISNLM